MKVPFRLQASEYDCVPTSLLNALSYLFEREEIPPSIIQRVYLNSMDNEAFRGSSFRGTSRPAIEILSIMLNNYRDNKYKKFAISSEFITESDVHLKKNSKVLECIDSGGVALIRVWLGQGKWHYILAFAHDNKFMHCFDSYQPSKMVRIGDAVMFVDNTEDQRHNLAIQFSWLDKMLTSPTIFETGKHKYVLGPKQDRECLLLSRA
jgi:hypothetical protein